MFDSAQFETLIWGLASLLFLAENPSGLVVNPQTFRVTKKFFFACMAIFVEFRDADKKVT
jgi:hypothetical protein